MECHVACQGILEDFLVDMEFSLAELVVHGPKVGDQALVGGALEDADGAEGERMLIQADGCAIHCRTTPAGAAARGITEGRNHSSRRGATQRTPRI